MRPVLHKSCLQISWAKTCLGSSRSYMKSCYQIMEVCPKANTSPTNRMSVATKAPWAMKYCCLYLSAKNISLLMSEKKTSILTQEETIMDGRPDFSREGESYPGGFWCHKISWSPVTRGSLFPNPSARALKVLYPLVIDERKMPLTDTALAWLTDLNSIKQIQKEELNFSQLHVVPEE